MIVHLPLFIETYDNDLKRTYRLLRGMGYLGYHLAYSRPIESTTYHHIDLRTTIATKYEMVWIRP